jgi:hypothetical protein
MNSRDRRHLRVRRVGGLAVGAGLLVAILLASYVGPATLLAQAGRYNLRSWTIDGGGGASSGGAYALGGTVGQLDAGILTGHTYTLVGGFWGGASAAAPTPTATGVITPPTATPVPATMTPTATMTPAATSTSEPSATPWRTETASTPVATPTATSSPAVLQLHIFLPATVNQASLTGAPSR